MLMKNLSFREISMKMESKPNSPSVVAKLMGLDMLPLNHPVAASERGHSGGHLQSHSCMPPDRWQQEYAFSDAQIPYGLHRSAQQNKCEDVYNIRWQSQHMDCFREKSLHNRSSNDNPNGKQMALVRQKFIEAKRLAMDDKLCQSKKFQDALEVLSSNKELLIKFLQEPNSLFPQHPYNFECIPSPPETKRITVLKPAKMQDNENFVGSGENNERWVRKFNAEFPSYVISKKVDDDSSRQTRIVVLKPSTGKYNGAKNVISPPLSSPTSTRGLGREELYEELEDVEAQESREAVKGSLDQLKESLSRHRRDNTLLSSMFSNGYTGDESSDSKSVSEYAVGKLNDSEVVAISSRNSWDCANRFDSPCFLSSFSRASHSPDSFVCREAKKRLSERWAMMSLNGGFHDQRYAGRTSSTLGEMLALSNSNRSVRSEEQNNNNNQGFKDSSSVTNDLVKDRRMDSAPRNLLKSKSVPASVMEYDTRANMGISYGEVDKTNIRDEVTKARSSKLTLKGKISSFLFSKNTKSRKDKYSLSLLECESSSADTLIAPEQTICNKFPSGDIVQHEGVPFRLNELDEVPFTDLVPINLQESADSLEVGLSCKKPVVLCHSSDNQDQPSPISVLEPLCVEDGQTTLDSSGKIRPKQQGSVARALSWENSSEVFAASCPLKLSSASQVVQKDELELFLYFQTLLSAAGLNSKVQNNLFIFGWHYLESPLDPSLRDIHLNQRDKDLLQNAMPTRSRSIQKLVFDYVNAALMGLSGYESEACERAVMYDWTCFGIVESSASSMVMELVWDQIKEWLSRDFGPEDNWEDSSFVEVERLVMKETLGRGWFDRLRLEMECVRKEIEMKLLEELMQETLVELSGSTNGFLVSL